MPKTGADLDQQETDMDFTGIVTSTNSWENVSPEAAFQSSAVGMIHRTLFPKVSWNKVKKSYHYDTGENAVTWDWYTRNCLGEPNVARLAFSRNLKVWNMTLKDLIFTPLNKLEIYKDYLESDCSSIAFPVVGKAVVLTPWLDTDYYGCDRIFKYDEESQFLLVPIKDYAENLGSFEFCLGGEDEEF